MSSRDLTEGRGSAVPNVGYAIAVDLGIVSSTSTWQNTDVSYDVAIGGMPFVYAVTDNTPYIRQTSPFRKEQSDVGTEPGEQSLSGWWMRSQSSFHNGTGIKFYDPTAGETIAYRYADSNNVDVWTKGEVTLLKETANMSGVTTGIYKLISAMSGSTNVVIGYIPGTTTIKAFQADGTVVTTYAPTNLGNILDGGVCTDGTRLFVADSDHIYTGLITNASSGWTEYYATGSRAVLGWVKQRLVAGITNSIYELTGATGGALALPTTPLFTHPNTAWVWSSISSAGPAVYAAGYAGGNSAIYKFVLTDSGGMPTLTSGIVAAQMPVGETINKIEFYLDYMMIGTSKGMRAAKVSDQDGSISYGPLIVEDSSGVRDFTFNDRFVWFTGTIGTNPGLYRIDLGSEIEPLRFAYATDTYLSGATGYATSVDFIGNGSQLAFTTSGSNGIAVQSATVLSSTGYITTGKIRYSTLEPKNFKRLVARGNFGVGDFTLASIATSNSGVETEYDHITYNIGVPPIEITTSSPALAQEYLAYKFTLARDAVTTLGPILKGWQAKATIATPRQRLIKFPVYCYDTETDRYNSVFGYVGRAWDRIQLLETIEAQGDVLTWQDLTTGESRQAVIEQVTFTRMTPPDKHFNGFGGVIEITIRTV